MLAANISAAERIYAEFPDCAMWRCHPAPPASNFVEIARLHHQRRLWQAAGGLAQPRDRPGPAVL